MSGDRCTVLIVPLLTLLRCCNSVAVVNVTLSCRNCCVMLHMVVVLLLAVAVAFVVGMAVAVVAVAVAVAAVVVDVVVV